MKLNFLLYFQEKRYQSRNQKKPVNFVPASQRVEISNFMQWFFLKGALLEPKPLAGVSSYCTQVSWQVWEKTDCWFPIQARKKSANFVPASQRLEISNLMGLVFLKGTLAQPKIVARASSDDSEGSWQVWGKTDSWFPIQPRKKCANFIPASHRVEISNLIG